MDFEQIEKLMAKLELSKLKKLVIKQGDFELQLEKDSEIQHVSAPIPTSRATFGEKPSDAPFTADPVPRAEGNVIKAPLVGTFYSSPSPKDPDFVKVGDVVKIGQPLCIIEAMKVMNEILAEKNGVVLRIFVEKGQPVEFGQHLFEIGHA